MIVGFEEEGEEQEEVGDGQAAVEDGRRHFPDFRAHCVQDGNIGWNPNSNQ